MANSAQARKRARQSVTRRQHTASMRSMMRTHMKKVLTALEAGDKDAATAAYAAAVPIIDRVANKGLIHKNKASRHKQRLNARLHALG